MFKKILSFYFLLFISLITFSQETYYSDVDLTLSGAALKDALASKITATHTTTLEYTSSGPDVWDATKATDENVANTNEVILYYGWEDGNDQDITNDISRSKNLQDCGTNCDDFVWNREHVFPKSLANPILDTSIPGPATDAHHLRASDRGRNSARNNRKYGRGSGNSNYSSLDFHEGLDGPNTAAWYPGDDWKGDAARMIMYMYMRYGAVCLPTAVGVGSKEFTEDDMIDLFLQWNAEDPVSEIEIARNEYHENTSNYAAQGNRNPFIDNPYLATRIWGGNSADDRWGIYKNSDTEAPTAPINISLSNIGLTSVDINWTASTDNIGVTGYNVYVDGVLEAQTTNTNITIAGLNTNTNYSFTIVARDLINNMSTAAAANGKTLQDTEAPTKPIGVVISNNTDSSFKVSWSASTDNNAVNGYEVFVDSNLEATATGLFYTVSSLNASSTYSVEIIAKDIDNNKSPKSVAINATTTAGTSNGITELFISEYVEPEGGNNKAIEIVNLTNTTISLQGYSLKKQYNGGSWVDDLPLNNAAFLVDPSVTSIIPNDVFVIIHTGAAESQLTNNADLVVPSNQEAPYKYASPLNFNGNDPVGLFKNGVLIDIIGEEGNSRSHIENTTYRRKANISEPNTTFNTNEWDVLAANTFDGIGSHTSVLSTNNSIFESFKMFPNPTSGNFVHFNVTEDATINIYNILGKLIQSVEVTQNKNSIDVSKFSDGIYMLKINSGKQFITKKLIKN